MSIQKSKAFVTSDAKVFVTIEEAQAHEIELSILSAGEFAKAFDSAVSMAKWLVDNRVELIGVLSSRKPRTPKAKPAAKKSKPQIVTEAA